MLFASLCIQCEKAEPEWGSFFCKPCGDQIKAPKPPERPDQGKPVAKRMSAFHKQRPNGWPR